MAELPVGVSYLLRDKSLFKLPGGFRGNFSPYIAALVNRRELPLRSVDYGTKLSLSSFVGQTSQLETQLGYQLGLNNLWRDTHQKFYNRSFYMSVIFIL